MKTCTKCKIPKEYSEFRDRDLPCGKYAECRECERERSAKGNLKRKAMRIFRDDPAVIEYVKENFGLMSSEAMGKAMGVSRFTIDNIIIDQELRVKRGRKPNKEKVLDSTYFNVDRFENWLA